MPTDIPTQHLALAHAALHHYALDQPTCTFLRHNENLVFHVTAAGQTYLLRIHQSGTNWPEPLLQSPAAIRSELIWREALATQTSILVQRPVRVPSGDWLVLLDAPQSTSPVACTLLHWLDGEPFSGECEHAIDLARAFGDAVAQIHDHSEHWIPPDGFTRFTYDEDRVRQTLRRIAPAVTDGLITDAEYAIMCQAGERIISVMHQLGRGRDKWGLVHADLGESNCLHHQGTIRLIDFSLSGFGHYLFDVGMALATLRPHLRRPFLEAYQRRRPSIAQHLYHIDAFVVFSVLLCFAFHIAGPARNTWLPERMRRCAADECPKLLRGQTYLPLE